MKYDAVVVARPHGGDAEVSLCLFKGVEDAGEAEELLLESWDMKEDWEAYQADESGNTEPPLYFEGTIMAPAGTLILEE